MPLLKIENVLLPLPQKKKVAPFNLTLQPGEIWGILGQNGSGKTTLLHVLANLLPITTGQICLDDIDLRTMTAKAVAKKLGIVFQQSHDTFPQTVWERCLSARFIHQKNMFWESEEDRKIALTALQEMQLDHLLKRNIQTLSGGERQRLAIAMILTQQPRLYLLDEPMNHLDIRYQRQVLNYFKTLSATTSAGIMMSLHDMNIAQQYCHKVLLLFNDGEHRHGDTKEMLTTENLSALYQYPIDAIRTETKILWTTCDKELMS